MYRKIRKLYRDPLAFFLDSDKSPLRSVGEGMFRRQTERFRLLGERHSDVKISVVMTAYNTGHLVEKAVRSVLNQNHRNLELIVVDDASSDDTVSCLQKLRQEDDRLKVFSSPTNHGTYWSKNWGIKNASGQYIATHDSDDTSDPDRLLMQLGALKANAAAVACTARWRRVNDAGEELEIDGRSERMAAISLMFDRQRVLENTGYYDSVRISADTEFITRLEHVFGKRHVLHLRHHLYTGLLRDDSLTRGEGSGFTWHAETGNRFRRALSGDRADYHQAFHVWHNRPEAKSGLRIDFPLDERPFVAAESMVRNCNDQNLDQVQEVL